MAGGDPNNPNEGSSYPQPGEREPHPDDGSQQGGGPQPSGYPPAGSYPQQGAPEGYPQHAYQPYGSPHQQSTAGYPYPANMPTEFFGGFWIRVASYIIDYIIVSIPGCFLGFALGLASAGAQQAGAATEPELGATFGIYGVAFVLSWLYYAILESKYGATLGKLALGLRVVEDGGMYPSFARATGRYFAKILSGCLLAIGYIMVAFHPQKRGLHDLIAATYVVRKECVNPQQLAEQ